jgi:hypothetical protein
MATISGLRVLRLENKERNTRLLPQQLCWKILRKDWGEAREGVALEDLVLGLLAGINWS